MIPYMISFVSDEEVPSKSVSIYRVPAHPAIWSPGLLGLGAEPSDKHILRRKAPCWGPGRELIYSGCGIDRTGVRETEILRGASEQRSPVGSYGSSLGISRTSGQRGLVC
jgi:hypothetical protein